MVFEHQSEYSSQWSAMTTIAQQLTCRTGQRDPPLRPWG
jgi:hypothetical protein